MASDPPRRAGLNRTRPPAVTRPPAPPPPSPLRTARVKPTRHRGRGANPMAAAAIRAAAGEEAEAVRYTGPERFDVLPLLVATDGAIEALGYDQRRLRPNILIGGVPGLAERDWPGFALRSGEVVIG